MVNSNNSLDHMLQACKDAVLLASTFKEIEVELRLPDMDDDAPSIKPRAYMHERLDTCVSVDSTTYDNHRVLVAWEDVVDYVDWLEHGIAEWREYAIEAGKQLKKLRGNG